MALWAAAEWETRRQVGCEERSSYRQRRIMFLPTQNHVRANRADGVLELRTQDHASRHDREGVAVKTRTEAAGRPGQSDSKIRTARVERGGIPRMMTGKNKWKPQV